MLWVAVCEIGLYSYFVYRVTVVDAEPNEQLLDNAAIAKPHYYVVPGAGMVRLTVTAKWVPHRFGHVWELGGR